MIAERIESEAPELEGIPGDLRALAVSPAVERIYERIEAEAATAWEAKTDG